MSRTKYQLKKELMIKGLALNNIENQVNGLLVSYWDEQELIDLLELKLELKSDIETLKDEIESKED